MHFIDGYYIFNPEHHRNLNIKNIYERFFLKKSDDKKTSYEKSKKEFGFIRWSNGGPLMHIAHAAGLCANVYTKFCEKLYESYEIIGMDFRGHGRTSAPAKSAKLLNWEPFYKDLEDFFRNQNQPIIALGHSMGGTVSAVIAARFPELMSKLVLIEPGFMPRYGNLLFILPKSRDYLCTYLLLPASQKEKSPGKTKQKQ